MNRNNNLKRLNQFNNSNIFDIYYLHYKFFHKDLKNIFDKYIKENATILDIGCGNKPYAQYIKNITKIYDRNSYIGCDIIQSSEYQVDIICEATNIPLESERFDAIICTQVLEHIFDNKDLISEAHRLLKNDGVFIISAPFIWEHHEEPFDFFRFTRFGFQNLLESSGFKIDHYCANGGKWATLGLIFNMTISTPIKVRYNFIHKTLTLFRICIYCLTNSIFYILDRIFTETDKLTINHTFVCRKEITKI